MNRTFVLGAALLFTVLGFALAGNQQEAVAGGGCNGLFARCDGGGLSAHRCHGGRDRCHGGLLARLRARRAARCCGDPAPTCCGVAPVCEPTCGAPAACADCAVVEPSCGAPVDCAVVEPSCGVPVDCAVVEPSCGVPAAPVESYDSSEVPAAPVSE